MDGSQKIRVSSEKKMKIHVVFVYEFNHFFFIIEDSWAKSAATRLTLLRVDSIPKQMFIHLHMKVNVG